MLGILVVNEYLTSKKFNDFYDFLVSTFNKEEINLKLITNAKYNDDKCDFCIFWDKDINLARYIENKGIRVYNKPDVIKICDNKIETQLILENKGVKMPKMLLAPFTYENVGYTNYDYLVKVKKEFRYPFIIKQAYGSFGEQVYLVNNDEELINIVKLIGSKPFLFHEYIDYRFGEDLRVFTVGRKIVGAVRRVGEKGNFKANVTLGGKMLQYTLSKEDEDIVYNVIDTLNLDFGGIDLLFSEKGLLVNEVNSNAHFLNFYKATNINVGIDIVKYVKKGGVIC